MALTQKSKLDFISLVWIFVCLKIYSTGWKATVSVLPTSFCSF